MCDMHGQHREQGPWSHVNTHTYTLGDRHAMWGVVETQATRRVVETCIHARRAVKTCTCTESHRDMHTHTERRGDMGTCTESRGDMRTCTESRGDMHPHPSSPSASFVSL